jgi:uncharacterized protein YggE
LIIDRRSSAPNTEHLTVRGEAKLEFVPDIVELSVAIQRTEETAALAKADVDARAARVVHVARSVGCESRDIRASDLAISPHREYRNGEYHHKGFAAELQVDIKLRDIKLFNLLLSQLVDVPVDRIIRIKPKLGDESSANQAALAKAIEDAKGKAEAIARQFGIRLGSLFSITALPIEDRFHVGGAAHRASQEDATFEPGTIEVEGKIEVTFYLEKPGPR